MDAMFISEGFMNACVLEQGTHEVLLRNTDGPYAQLVHRQITKESNEINADAAPAGACLYRYIPAWYHIWSSTCALILRSCIGEYQSCMDAMFISEEFMNARSQ